jgi:hypothetical protein
MYIFLFLLFSFRCHFVFISFPPRFSRASMTAASLMKHSWLQGVGTSKTPLGAGLKGTLKGFRYVHSRHSISEVLFRVLFFCCLFSSSSSFVVRFSIPFHSHSARDYNNLVTSMAAQFKQDGRGSVRGRAGDTIDNNKIGIQQPAKDARRYVEAMRGVSGESGCVMR